MKEAVLAGSTNHCHPLRECFVGFIPEQEIVSPLSLVPCISLELLGTAFSPPRFRFVSQGGNIITGPCIFSVGFYLVMQ